MHMTGPDFFFSGTPDVIKSSDDEDEITTSH